MIWGYPYLFRNHHFTSIFFSRFRFHHERPSMKKDLYHVWGSNIGFEASENLWGISKSPWGFLGRFGAPDILIFTGIWGFHGDLPAWMINIDPEIAQKRNSGDSSSKTRLGRVYVKICWRVMIFTHQTVFCLRCHLSTSGLSNDVIK